MKKSLALILCFIMVVSMGIAFAVECGTFIEKDGEGHDVFCTKEAICGGKCEDHLTHNYSGGVCTNCGASQPPSPCTHVSRTQHAENPATCNADGNKEYWVCSCGLKFTTSDGSETISDVVLPKTGHDMDDWVTSGTQQTRKCKNCDYVETKSVPTPPPCEHTYKDEGTKTDAAGNVTHDYTCTKCGNIKKDVISHGTKSASYPKSASILAPSTICPSPSSGSSCSHCYVWTRGVDGCGMTFERGCCPKCGNIKINYISSGAAGSCPADTCPTGTCPNRYNCPANGNCGTCPNRNNCPGSNNCGICPSYNSTIYYPNCATCGKYHDDGVVCTVDRRTGKTVCYNIPTGTLATPRTGDASLLGVFIPA